LRSTSAGRRSASGRPILHDRATASATAIDVGVHPLPPGQQPRGKSSPDRAAVRDSIDLRRIYSTIAHRSIFILLIKSTYRRASAGYGA